MSGFAYSVVVPYHENADTVVRALDSLVEQEPQPSQVLICDDASSAASAADLHVRAAQHPLAARIRVLTHDLNQGPGAARNTAWAEVTTPWVCFLDADDAWHPLKMLIQRRFLAEHPETTILGTLVSVRQHTKTVPTLLESNIRSSPVSVHRQLLRNHFATSSVITRTAAIERFDPNQRYAEDYDLWCRLLLGGGRGAVIKAPLTFAFKPPFGHSGASGRLFLMQLGSFGVLRRLRRQGAIGPLAYFVFGSASWLRFSRRLAITSYRRSVTVLKPSLATIQKTEYLNDRQR